MKEKRWRDAATHKSLIMNYIIKRKCCKKKIRFSI